MSDSVKNASRDLLRGVLGSIVGGAKFHVLDNGTHPTEQCSSPAAVAIAVPV